MTVLSARHVAVACVLLALPSVRPAQAQTLAAAARAVAATVDADVITSPDPPATSLQPPVPAPDLRTRTGQFNPARFNLASTGGSGLIQAVSPYSLRRWELATGGAVVNFDRDPGDVDFFEYGIQFAVGLPGRTEFFFMATPVLRTNSVNQDPLGYPVPPLDLFIDTYPTTAQRSQPYFLYPQEVPYKSYNIAGANSVRRIEPPGHGAFASSSGDYIAGGKINLLSEDRGDHFGFGTRVYFEIPSERPSYNSNDWRRAAGVSGKVDVGGDLLFAKRIKRAELLMNVGYEHAGDPPRGMRVQFVDSSKWNTVDPATGQPASILVGAPVISRLDLRDEVAGTIGTAVPAVTIHGLDFWVLGELSYTHYIAGATRVERIVNPAEMRLGIQANVPKFPSISIGAAWQLMMTNGGNGTTRRSNFVTPDGRGDINFSTNVNPDLAQTFGAAMAARGATFSPNTSEMFSTDNTFFDPLRNVPAGDTPVVARGNGNILAFITWRLR
jgi:hypothetical protein